jgi:hypothetical protein
MPRPSRTATRNRSPLLSDYAFNPSDFHQIGVAAPAGWAARGCGRRALTISAIGRLTLEYRLDDDPPRAACAYALQNIAAIDAGIACWDGKYTYWAIRPFQLDPEVKTLFPTPNHPSYPAAHACLSTAEAAILGYLFPRDAEALAALAEEARESRVWAGICAICSRAGGLTATGSNTFEAAAIDAEDRACAFPAPHLGNARS